MCLLLLHFCHKLLYFTENHFIREKKKSCDIAFTKHYLFLWLAEKQLRNSSEEECLEKFRLPLLGDLLPLEQYRQK